MIQTSVFVSKKKVLFSSYPYFSALIFSNFRRLGNRARPSAQFYHRSSLPRLLKVQTSRQPRTCNSVAKSKGVDRASHSRYRFALECLVSRAHCPICDDLQEAVRFTSSNESFSLLTQFLFCRNRSHKFTATMLRDIAYMLGSPDNISVTVVDFNT